MLHGGIGGIGMGIAEALGPIGMSLAAAAAAITFASSKMQERIEKRQASTADTQQFDNALDNSSSDPATRKRFKEAYVHDYQEFGMQIDKESARTYSNAVQGLTQKGYTPDEAIKVMKDRSAMFRAGNLSATQQESINLQLGQVLAKGKAQGDDFKPIHVAVGANIANMMDIGAAKYLGYKGKDKGASGFMLQAQKAGTISPRALDAGIAYAVEHSKEALERHKGSIDAREARLKNDQYLQTAKQQEDPALVGAINSRIEAERSLVEAMAPANKMFEELDKSLTNFDTGLINLTAKLFNLSAGKNVDGSEKTDQEKTQDRMTTADMPVSLGMVGTHDYSNVDGNSQHQGGPVGNFWNWALGIKDKPSNTPALGTPSIPDLDTGSQSFKSASDKNLNYQPKQLKMPNLYDTFSAMQSAMSDTGSMQAAATTSQVFNTPINVTNTINTTIAGSATEADAVKFMDHVKSEIDTLSQTIPGLAKGAVTDMLGAARALQYDGQ